MSRKGKSKAKRRRQQQRQQAATQQQQKQHVAPSQPAENAPADVNKCYEWTLTKERAAQLLAEDHSTDVDIAATLGVTVMTLWRWKQVHEFAERVESIRKELADHAKRFLIARKSFRLGNYQSRLLAMQQIIEERGNDPELQKARGGSSGMLVRKLKTVGSGPAAEIVEEFVFDAALAKAMLELEKQAAQEAGQWVDKVAPTSPDGGEQYRGSGLSDAEFDALSLSERIRVLQEEMAAHKRPDDAKPVP